MPGNFTFCRQSLENKASVGDFLVKLSIVPLNEVSLSSPICQECLLFVVSADRAYVIAEENIYMLKSRRSHRPSETVPEVATGEGESFEKVPTGQGTEL